jgi:hypothetical protein
MARTTTRFFGKTLTRIPCSNEESVMKAALIRMKSDDGLLEDRVRPVQLVDNDGEDALVALAGLIASGAAGREMIGYQQIANADLEGVAALNPPEGATSARVQNNGTMHCRWRADGEDPQRMMGMRLYGGTDQTFVGNLEAVRFIREGDNVVLDVAYYV